ncbi:MAG: hypothetical protein JNK29_03970, partial [Anaerolineales bacterium]|nr:hypothetical protein [Anaerolineales bacterium]
LIARGELDPALALSERLLQVAEAARQTWSMVELRLLQALVFQAQKELAQALAALEKALVLGRPAGLVRTFLDEGEPLAKLLYQAKVRQLGAGYPAELLSGMDQTSRPAPPPAQLLIEPLTLREIEVLRLIEAGCSNQDIAARLVLSLPTVKRHISNIYNKLGAANRAQAIARGRELKLFE